MTASLLSVLLQLGGLVAEILGVLGVLLMANGFLHRVTVGVLPRLLLSALVRGDVARGVVRTALEPSKDLAALQGLAFIGLGFFCQAIGLALSLLPACSF
jgi:hypothetical protein